MEARAAADSAYLTEHTARLVQGYFELRDLGASDPARSAGRMKVLHDHQHQAGARKSDRANCSLLPRLLSAADAK